MHSSFFYVANVMKNEIGNRMCAKWKHTYVDTYSISFWCEEWGHMYTFHRSISNIMFCMQNLLGGSLSNSIVTGRKLINSKLYNYTILSCTMHTRINAVNASTHKSIQSRIDNSRRKEKMLVRNVYIHFLSSINAKFMLHARYLSTCVNEKKNLRK